MIRPLAILAIATLVVAAEDSATLWTAKVQPLLADRCIQCHGPVKAKHDLRLDTREAILKGGKELGPAIDLAKPEASAILKVCTLPRDEELAMPPQGKGKQLSPEELGWIKAWIVGGAKVP